MKQARRSHLPDIHVAATPASPFSEGKPKERRRRRGYRTTGFTLIECMIAMFLIAIVLPTVELSFASITKSADLARHRTEAAGLAQSQLASLIASGNWQGTATLNGDFGPDGPKYTWQAVVSVWTGNANQATNSSSTITLQQLDVTVSWGSAPAGTPPAPGTSVTVSGLVYQRSTSTD